MHNMSWLTELIDDYDGASKGLIWDWNPGLVSFKVLGSNPRLERLLYFVFCISLKVDF